LPLIIAGVERIRFPSLFSDPNSFLRNLLDEVTKGGASKLLEVVSNPFEYSMKYVQNKLDERPLHSNQNNCGYLFCWLADVGLQTDRLIKSTERNKTNIFIHDLFNMK
jgi:hypothetical protein